VLLSHRIRPAQSWEPREVPVGCVENAAMFHSQSGKLRIGEQWTTSLSFTHHLAQDGPVTFARREQPHNGLFHPQIDNLNRPVQCDSLAR
jgi:hypothetical protein